MKNAFIWIVILLAVGIIVFGMYKLFSAGAPKYKAGKSPEFGSYKFGKGCGLSIPQSTKQFSYSYPGDTVLLQGSSKCQHHISEQERQRGNAAFLYNLTEGGVSRT